MNAENLIDMNMDSPVKEVKYKCRYYASVLVQFKNNTHSLYIFVAAENHNLTIKDYLFDYF